MYLANLLNTAVSVLASTVRLTVSFMEPLMTVSVMLRCSASSSSVLDPLESLEEGGATLLSNQPSQSGVSQIRRNTSQVFILPSTSYVS